MLPRAEIAQLLTHATVFVCPSVYEPLGIVNLEAMACETAVVAVGDRRHPRGRRRRADRHRSCPTSPCRRRSSRRGLADAVNALCARPGARRRDGPGRPRARGARVRLGHDRAPYCRAVRVAGLAEVDVDASRTGAPDQAGRRDRGSAARGGRVPHRAGAARRAAPSRRPGRADHGLPAPEPARREQPRRRGAPRGRRDPVPAVRRDRSTRRTTTTWCAASAAARSRSRAPRSRPGPSASRRGRLHRHQPHRRAVRPVRGALPRRPPREWSVAASVVRYSDHDGN